MLKKITFLYTRHFRFIIALNLFVSLYFTSLFWYKGYDHYPLYMIALLFKIVGYALTAGIEKFFFEARSYHYRNLGFGYRVLFGGLFMADLLTFTCILLISYACRSFI